MKHILQRCESDCFPTCVAMVADITYKQALKLVHPDHVRGQDYSTSDVRAHHVLKRLGFNIITKKKLQNFYSITNPAIIAIKLKCEKNGHVLVWDPDKQKLLEPYKGYRSLPRSLYLSSIEWVWELSK